MVPASGVINSYRYLPVFGAVIVFEEPSPPDTLSATLTAVGIVIVCAVDAYVMSKIILPSVDDAGKFENAKVIAAFDVIV